MILKWLTYIIVLISIPGNENYINPSSSYCNSEEGMGLRFEKSCYYTVFTKKSWEEAEQYCVKTYGSHLITVLDESIENYLGIIIGSLFTEVWIGIKIRDHYLQKWTSGWYVGYNGFRTDYRNFTKGTCVSRERAKSNVTDKLWNIVSCDKRLSFICEKSDEDLIIPTLKPPVEGSYCPLRNWIDLDGEMCYFIETKHKRTFQEAYDTCLSSSANLLSIHSEEEGQVLKSLLRYETRYVYIGLIQNDEKNFEWTDGSVMNFENWYSQQPNRTCVVVRTNTMKWRSMHCSFKAPYICAIKKITPSFTLTSTEKTKTDGDSSLTPRFTVTSTEQAKTDGDISLTPSFTVTSTEETKTNDDISLTPSFTVTSTEKAKTNDDISLTPKFTLTSIEKSKTDGDISLTPSSSLTSTEKSKTDGDISHALLVKVLIGVIVCIFINIFVIGAVIYYFRTNYVKRHKTSLDVIGLQVCVPEVPRRTFKSAERVITEEEPYYEPMDG